MEDNQTCPSCKVGRIKLESGTKPMIFEKKILNYFYCLRCNFSEYSENEGPQLRFIE